MHRAHFCEVDVLWYRGGRRRGRRRLRTRASPERESVCECVCGCVCVREREREGEGVRDADRRSGCAPPSTLLNALSPAWRPPPACCASRLSNEPSSLCSLRKRPALDAFSARPCTRECVCVSECVCVRERERERERVCVCVCVREREGEGVRDADRRRQVSRRRRPSPLHCRRRQWRLMVKLMVKFWRCARRAARPALGFRV